MGNQKNSPDLRFPEFNDEWVGMKLKDMLLSYRLGGNYQNSENVSKHPLIKMGNLNRGSISLNKISYIDDSETIEENDRIVNGDIFFNTRNTLDLVGKVAIWRDELPEAYYNSNLMRMKFDNNFFMNYCLNTYNAIKGLKRFATGTTSVAAIYTKDLLKLNLSIPTLPEQQKIASFLTAIDKRIDLLTQKKENLTKYKKAIMQQIFSQQIRFKDDNGNDFPEWKVKKLKDISSKNINKNKNLDYRNVLTNSAKYGIVLQADFFEKDIANQNNLEGYYVVKKDDFIYNPRISRLAPVGPLKRNKLVTGVMSPLYTVLTLKNCCVGFFEYYFDSYFWHKWMYNVSNVGARHDRMNVSDSDFFNMPIPFPTLSEQKKINHFITLVVDKIDSANQQLEQNKAYKKALLQQMFV